LENLLLVAAANEHTTLSRGLEERRPRDKRGAVGSVLAYLLGSAGEESEGDEDEDGQRELEERREKRKIGLSLETRDDAASDGVWSRWLAAGPGRRRRWRRRRSSYITSTPDRQD